ncbi:ferredoxin reductase family protein [Micromonospora humidisoli]|uniref:Ferric reductase-like transmembrane domain-containing protein n=1 Tax=Micromonospora humidisoli TaxID=2807622 RepID=A0ABS2JCQ0_9ACTN|nr:ferric reductase-like transmembrane domain-containing protein [Micromonospora humidisoli]MBM7084338.1 ferric reductase-like transmembrane domain-containing protein [Micromonospora humidisoli]
MTYRDTHAAGRRTREPSRYAGRPAASVSPPPARPRRGSAGRRVLSGLFWAGLVAAVLPWWLDTPAGSLAGTADVLTAAGRVTGLVAGYLLLVQVLMMSRLGVLERGVGGERLSRVHRDLGATLLVAVLAHLSLLVVGYARTQGNPVTAQPGVLLRDFDDMVSAFAAAGILVLVGGTGIRAVRRALPYELWYHLHLTSYLALLLGFGHQFSNGAQLFPPGPVRTGWIAAYLLVAAALVWGRLVAPVLLNLRHRLRVADVVAESPDTVSIYLTGRRLHQLDPLGGQYLRWRFLARGCWWQSHPFSLSAAANGRWLRLTVKVVGGHTRDLRDLDPGTRVWAEGPSGTFTAAHRTRDRALLIAGGSGIGPLRAMLEELPAGAALIYRARTPADVLLQHELDWLAQARRTDVWYVVGSRDDAGPRQVMNPDGLRRLVPDLTRRDVYLCGPQGLVDSSVRMLRQAGVPRRQIHLAPFEL